MEKFKKFMSIFVLLLALGLFVGPTGDYTLNDIGEGIIVLSPFCLLSAWAVSNICKK